MFCQKCGQEVETGVFCANCGNRLDMPSVICYCSNCGAPVEDGSDVCVACGKEIEGLYRKEDMPIYGRGTAIADNEPSEKPKKKGLVIAIIAAVIVAAAVAAGIMYANGLFGSKGGENTDVAYNVDVAAEDVFAQGRAIRIMTKSFSTAPAGKDSPVMKALEETVGSELAIKWVADTNYSSELASVIGSGKYPHVMLITDKSPAFIQAARNDMFWDISSVFDDPEKYPNLSQANADVNHNISIDGKIYGIYRSRVIGRAGVSIRKDWLDRLGEPIPETIDDFDRIMERFTTEDPDGDGVDGNTYGMVVTNYINGPLDNLAIWCGAPNTWGTDANGELMPSFTFDEYTHALELMRKWYSKGYINNDISTMSTDKWNEPFLNGKAGIIIDVADRARRLDTNITEYDANARVDVFGYVKKDHNSPIVTLPTTGYDGFFVFPKLTVKTREDLEYILGIMDKLNSPEATNLMNFGIEGIHYVKGADGKVIKNSDDALVAQYSDLNQILMSLVENDDILSGAYTTPIAEKVEEVYEDNEQHALHNPAAPYLSETQSKRATQLDAIMNEAKIQFITGNISVADYKKEIERWKNEGGNDIIKEINAEYKKDASVK